MAWVIKKTNTDGASYANVKCVRQKNIWVLQGGVNWVWSASAATHFRVKHAAEAAIVQLPMSPGDKLELLSI